MKRLTACNPKLVLITAVLGFGGFLLTKYVNHPEPGSNSVSVLNEKPSIQPVAQSSKQHGSVTQSSIQHQISGGRNMSRLPYRQVVGESNIHNEQICLHYDTSKETCETVFKTPASVKDLYPVQLVSGAPGSGNDWILWLGANVGYHKDLDFLGTKCETYNSKTYRRQSKDGDYVTDCVFVKTHEPWFDLNLKRNVYKHVHRAALILRHPFDSAFSDYKRAVVVGDLKKTDPAYKEAKKSAAKVVMSLFLDENNKIKKGTRWQSISKGHVQKWRNHAKFWLEEWKGALKIIMYKDFVSDIQNSLHDLLYYLGFPFDEQNLHRHCCVLKHPINEAIKRERSVIDDYREYLLDGDEALKKLSENVTSEIQQLLDKRWPGIYKLQRG